MPYKSDRQRKFMNWAASKGKIKKSVVNDFNKASKGMDLPEQAPKDRFNKLKKYMKGS